MTEKGYKDAEARRRYKTEWMRRKREREEREERERQIADEIEAF